MKTLKPFTALCSTAALWLTAQDSGFAQSVTVDILQEDSVQDLNDNSQATTLEGMHEIALRHRTAGDVKRPQNKITYPPNGRDVASAVISVTGTARDNMSVASVWYCLNGGEWRLATSYDHWANWMALNLNLAPGQNAIQSFALDTSGNVSATNRVKFEWLAWSGSWSGFCKTAAGDVAVRMSLTQSGNSVTGFLVQDGSRVGLGTLSVSLVNGVVSSVEWPPVYSRSHKDSLTIYGSQNRVMFFLVLNRNGITGFESGAFEGSVELRRN